MSTPAENTLPNAEEAVKAAEELLWSPPRLDSMARTILTARLVRWTAEGLPRLLLELNSLRGSHKVADDYCRLAELWEYRARELGWQYKPVEEPQ